MKIKFDDSIKEKIFKEIKDIVFENAELAETNRKSTGEELKKYFDKSSYMVLKNVLKEYRLNEIRCIENSKGEIMEFQIFVDSKKIKKEMLNEMKNVSVEVINTFLDNSILIIKIKDEE